MINEVKKMKKFLKYIAVFFLCLTLVGCSSSQSEEKEQKKTNYLKGKKSLFAQ